jgi:hypothetical protein
MTLDLTTSSSTSACTSVCVFASVSVLLVIFTTSAFSSMLISALLFFLNLVY